MMGNPEWSKENSSSLCERTSPSTGSAEPNEEIQCPNVENAVENSNPFALTITRVQTAGKKCIHYLLSVTQG